MPRLFSFGAVAAASLFALSAQAQTTMGGAAGSPSTGTTVNGGAPVTTGSTTSVGQTKPPGTAADGTRPDLDVKSRELDHKIKTGICTGCN